jgi:hypothetical protein
MSFTVRFLSRTLGLELIAIACATVGLAVVGTIVTQALLAATPSASCLPLLYSNVTSSQVAGCAGVLEILSLKEVATPILLALSLLPATAGALVGSQLVGREIEQRTAVLGWSIDPSRRRWLAERAISALAIAGIVGVVAAIASTRLATAAFPGVDLWQAFLGFGFWGPPLVLRGIAAVAVGLLAGAVLGRMVPALLVSLALSAALLIGIDLVAPGLMPTRTIDDAGGRDRDMTALYVDSTLRAADGRTLTFAEARLSAPSGLDEGAMSDWIYTHYVPLAVVIPGDEAPLARLASAIAMLGITALALVATAAVVSKRRPY